jgi:hypothetical protein
MWIVLGFFLAFLNALMKKIADAKGFSSGLSSQPRKFNYNAHQFMSLAYMMLLGMCYVVRQVLMSSGRLIRPAADSGIGFSAKMNSQIVFSEACKNSLAIMIPELADGAPIFLPGRGNFGNAFYFVNHALAVAEFFGSRRVLIGNATCFLNRSFVTSRGVRVEVDSPPPVGWRKKIAAWTTPWPRECGAAEWLAGTSLWSELVELLPRPVVKLGPDAMVIFLRSGDIWGPEKPFGHWGYGQPPCAFFWEAFRKSGAKRAFVTTEAFDGPRANACTSRVLEFARPIAPGIGQTLSLLLNARHVAIGRSSLGEATALIAAGRQTLFAFNQTGTRLMMGGFSLPPHWDAGATEGWLREFPGMNWEETPSQVKAVLEEGIDGWTWSDPSLRFPTLIS